MPALTPPPHPNGNHSHGNQPTTPNSPLPPPPSRRHWNSSPAYQSFHSPSPSTPFFSPSSAKSSPNINQIPRRKHQSPTEIHDRIANPSPKGPFLILREPRQTHPLIWCGAVCCLVLILLLIFFAISTLIVFLVVRPKHPLFDIPNANFNAISFSPPDLFRSDFSVLANFSNPNEKIDLRLKTVDLQLIFSNRVISTQSIQPFELKRGGKVGRWEIVRMVSGLVRLPLHTAGALQRKVESGRVEYAIKVRFRVQAIVSPLGHWCKFSYWQHAACQLVVTAPPTGVLVARTCSSNSNS